MAAAVRHDVALYGAEGNVKVIEQACDRFDNWTGKSSWKSDYSLSVPCWMKVKDKNMRGNVKYCMIQRVCRQHALFFLSIHTFITHCVPPLSPLEFSLSPSLPMPLTISHLFPSVPPSSPTLSLACTLTHSLAHSLTRSLTRSPTHSLSHDLSWYSGRSLLFPPTRMGQAPRFVIVGFAEHEPVFTTDWKHLLPMKIWS